MHKNQILIVFSEKFNVIPLSLLEVFRMSFIFSRDNN